MRFTLKCKAEEGNGLGVRSCAGFCGGWQSPWAEQAAGKENTSKVAV